MIRNNFNFGKKPQSGTAAEQLARRSEQSYNAVIEAAKKRGSRPLGDPSLKKGAIPESFTPESKFTYEQSGSEKVADFETNFLRAKLNAEGYSAAVVQKSLVSAGYTQNTVQYLEQIKKDQVTTTVVDIKLNTESLCDGARAYSVFNPNRENNAQMVATTLSMIPRVSKSTAYRSIAIPGTYKVYQARYLGHMISTGISADVAPLKLVSQVLSGSVCKSEILDVAGHREKVEGLTPIVIQTAPMLACCISVGLTPSVAKSSIIHSPIMPLPTDVSGFRRCGTSGLICGFYNKGEEPDTMPMSSSENDLTIKSVVPTAIKPLTNCGSGVLDGSEVTFEVKNPGTTHTRFLASTEPIDYNSLGLSVNIIPLKKVDKVEATRLIREAIHVLVQAQSRFNTDICVVPDKIIKECVKSRLGLHIYEGGFNDRQVRPDLALTEITRRSESCVTSYGAQDVLLQTVFSLREVDFLPEEWATFFMMCTTDTVMSAVRLFRAAVANGPYRPHFRSALGAFFSSACSIIEREGLMVRGDTSSGYYYRIKAISTFIASFLKRVDCGPTMYCLPEAGVAGRVTNQPRVAFKSRPRYSIELGEDVPLPAGFKAYEPQNEKVTATGSDATNPSRVIVAAGFKNCRSSVGVYMTDKKVECSPSTLIQNHLNAIRRDSKSGPSVAGIVSGFMLFGIAMNKTSHSHALSAQGVMKSMVDESHKLFDEIGLDLLTISTSSMLGITCAESNMSLLMPMWASTTLGPVGVVLSHCLRLCCPFDYDKYWAFNPQIMDSMDSEYPCDLGLISSDEESYKTIIEKMVVGGADRDDLSGTPVHQPNPGYEVNVNVEGLKAAVRFVKCVLSIECNYSDCVDIASTMLSYLLSCVGDITIRGTVVESSQSLADHEANGKTFLDALKIQDTSVAISTCITGKLTNTRSEVDASFDKDIIEGRENLYKSIRSLNCNGLKSILGATKGIVSNGSPLDKERMIELEKQPGYRVDFANLLPGTLTEDKFQKPLLVNLSAPCFNDKYVVEKSGLGIFYSICVDQLVANQHKYADHDFSAFKAKKQEGSTSDSGVSSSDTDKTKGISESKKTEDPEAANPSRVEDLGKGADSAKEGPKQTDPKPLPKSADPVEKKGDPEPKPKPEAGGSEPSSDPKPGHEPSAGDKMLMMLENEFKDVSNLSIDQAETGEAYAEIVKQWYDTYSKDGVSLEAREDELLSAVGRDVFQGTSRPILYREVAAALIIESLFDKTKDEKEDLYHFTPIIDRELCLALKLLPYTSNNVLKLIPGGVSVPAIDASLEAAGITGGQIVDDWKEFKSESLVRREARFEAVF